MSEAILARYKQASQLVAIKLDEWHRPQPTRGLRYSGGTRPGGKKPYSGSLTGNPAKAEKRLPL